MRETRLYGSEGGGIELNRFSLPYLGCNTLQRYAEEDLCGLVIANNNYNVRDRSPL